MRISDCSSDVCSSDLWLHRNTRSGAQRNIHAHYDLGNDFYEQWLGGTMIYSSALYSAAGEEAPNGLSQFVTELDAAQSAKVGAIAGRLDLKRGNRVQNGRAHV